MDRRIHRIGTDRALQKLIYASGRSSCRRTDNICNDGGRGGTAVSLRRRELVRLVAITVLMDLIPRRRDALHTICLHYHNQFFSKSKSPKIQKKLGLFLSRLSRISLSRKIKKFLSFTTDFNKIKSKKQYFASLPLLGIFENGFVRQIW